MHRNIYRVTATIIVEAPSEEHAIDAIINALQAFPDWEEDQPAFINEWGPMVATQITVEEEGIKP
jgi:hypothetical protein